MKKKDREAVIDKLNSMETRIIISTYGLFSTGIDISTLEVMLLGSPIKSETKLKQSLGRLMRKGHKGKSPAVIDFLDYKVELLKWQGKTRSRIIRKVIED
jgi:superfamily II DNA or RNA helicase